MVKAQLPSTRAFPEPARKRLLKFIGGEVELLVTKAMDSAGKHWDSAEKELKQEMGYGKLITKHDRIEKRIEQLQLDLKEVTAEIEAKGGNSYITPEQYEEAGLVIGDRAYDKYGRNQAPIFLGHAIRTEWDLKVYNKLKERFSIDVVLKVLNQVGHAVERDITLAADFGSAQKAYFQFYELLEKACEEDAPPLLTAIVDNMAPALLTGPMENAPALAAANAKREHRPVGFTGTRDG